MLAKYASPLPEGWKEKYDPGTGRHFYWCTRTDRVSWLPPGHPKAKVGNIELNNSIHNEARKFMFTKSSSYSSIIFCSIYQVTEPASHVREMLQGQLHNENEDDIDEDDEEDEDQAMDLDSDMVS